MNLPTENRVPPHSVGIVDEDGAEILGGGTVAVLDRAVEWMRFCYSCNGLHLFIADRECFDGLIGRCSHCSDERIAAFTRVNSEVA